MLRGKGYTNNRFKKKDGSSDVMVSLKNDTEADIGELFFSRQAEKLSFKKAVGVFERYPDVTPPNPGNLPYKVFTAVITQSDANSFKQIDTGELTPGATYFINENSPGMDFTNVGAPNNNIGSYFIATGAVPASWGSNEGTGNNTLGWDSGAPRAKVLENTLGVNAGFEYANEGVYILFFDASLFESSNAYVTLSNPVSVNNSDVFSAQAVPIFFNIVGIETYQMLTQTPVNDVLGNGLVSNILEIRIYNDTLI